MMTAPVPALIDEIMTKQPFFLSETDDLQVADHLMRQASIRHLPVLREGKVVGLLSHRDFLAASVSHLASLSQREHDEFLQSIAVGQVMKRQVCVVNPNTTVLAACELLLRNRIGCLPVESDHQLVGIVTATDFLKIAYLLLGGNTRHLHTTLRQP